MEIFRGSRYAVACESKQLTMEWEDANHNLVPTKLASQYFSGVGTFCKGISMVASINTEGPGYGHEAQRDSL